MSIEDTLWAYLRTGLRGRWHAQRHEDKLTKGIPDISYAMQNVDGWIELKALDDWPKYGDTPVRLNLTPDQANWLRDRCAMGNGEVWILLRVGHGGEREHLLFHATDAYELRDGASRMHMYEIAKKRWGRSIKWTELEAMLCE